MEIASPLADPRPGAALVGALVVAMGWPVSGCRERDRRRMEERSIDVQTALAAEIQHYVYVLGNPEFDLKAVGKNGVRQMEEDMAYVPLIPSERNDTMSQSILPGVQILPEALGLWQMAFGLIAKNLDPKNAERRVDSRGAGPSDQ